MASVAPFMARHSQSTPRSPANPAHAIRLLCRSGQHRTPTPGLCPGHIQANLLILPSAAAQDFRLLCARNPVPCPLLGHSLIAGDPGTFNLNNSNLIQTSDFNITTDLPSYEVYEDGVWMYSTTDVRKEWTHDHVAFLIGCSFSFDDKLRDETLVPRHLEMGRNVSMYRTTRQLNPAGIFKGSNYVVSMRPYRPEDIERVRDITRPFEATHGEPIAWGWEAMKELGIVDIGKPEFGQAVEIRPGEVPVFWGCGVTPQVAVMDAGDKIKGTVMAHSPGHMLILDLNEEDLFVRSRLTGHASKV